MDWRDGLTAGTATATASSSVSTPRARAHFRTQAVRDLLLSVSFDGEASVVRVDAAVALPAGADLTPLRALAGLQAEHVLLDLGPAAFSAAGAAFESAAVTAVDTAWEGVGYEHMHDVTIWPTAGDPDADVKLKLMAAAGLTPLHLLRASDGTQQVGIQWRRPRARAGGDGPRRGDGSGRGTVPPGWLFFAAARARHFPAGPPPGCSASTAGSPARHD